MPNKKEEHTLAWLRKHIQQGEKITIFFCLNAQDGTLTGQKLLALLHAVQSMNVPYEFHVEVNDPDYYQVWQKNNAAFLNDSGLKANGGARNVTILRSTQRWGLLKEQYVKLRASLPTLEPGLLHDIQEAVKNHPEWKKEKNWEAKAREHVIDAAVDLLASHRIQSENNNLADRLWYPNKLNQTQSHAMQVAHRFGLETNSLRHFKYNMKEVTDNYNASGRFASAVVGSEEKQMHTDAADPSSMSLSPVTSRESSPRPSPALDPMSSDDSTRKSPQKPLKTRGISPPKLDINEDVMLHIQKEKEELERKKAEFELEKARQQQQIEERYRKIEEITAKQMESMQALILQQQELLRFQIQQTQLQPLALPSDCSSTYQHLFQGPFSEGKAPATPAAGPAPVHTVRVLVTRPGPTGRSHTTESFYTPAAVAGLVQNGLMMKNAPSNNRQTAASQAPVLPRPGSASRKQQRSVLPAAQPQR